MSQLLIQQYLNNLQDLRKVSGTSRESVVREAFKDLLKGWGRSLDLVFVPEYEITTAARDRRYVDGALLHALRVPFGHWEAKDEKDDLDDEIANKFRRGYPQDNIIFEDSVQAVLIQNRGEVMRCAVEDVDALEKLLGLFFSYERTEIAQFRKAVEVFKTDLPAVLDALREMIVKAQQDQPEFAAAAKVFLDHSREAINPSLTEADVREMLIQHILTEEIFSKVFGEDDFHRQNNVAKALYDLEATFFRGDLKKKTLHALNPYYGAIRAAAAQIGSHQEKQAFLKVIYENFYKVYNPKAADRLGVVYTPNEVVRFMIESADWLCEKHFGRSLIDPQVQILDPATGTGTFICELLEHFRGQPQKLKHKYREELHANEVAILPYYVANLNIEATYAAITGEYAEFPNLCFVDTLDNVAGLRKYAGHQHDLFGSLSEENVERIRRQNLRKISVVIGNPPYNANQLNENENNKNREYPDIDQRIKATYIAASTAQKTKLYDMYARFFRWASDRVDENGIVAFITNRSFVDSRTFDGFRDVVAREFNEIWIADLGGDVRANPKLSGTKHNVFGIQTGVAVSFLVKRKKAQGCRIFYARRPEMETAEEKLSFLGGVQLRDLAAEEVQPDKAHNWIHVTANDYESLIPLAGRRREKTARGEPRKLLSSLVGGVKTNRDEWVFDFDAGTLRRKVEFFFKRLSRRDANGKALLDPALKWSRDLKAKIVRGVVPQQSDGHVVPAVYRPFVKKAYWVDKTLSDVLTDLHSRTYGARLLAKNPTIVFSDTAARAPFGALACDSPFEHHLAASSDSFQGVSLHRIEEDGTRVDNVTDWGLEQFRKHYQPGRAKVKRPITKDAIFHYVYAVLHDPVYREKYAQNLKREFPRIPFYADFWLWADAGEELMRLHLGYETVEPFPLKRTEHADPDYDDPNVKPKVLLKAEKDMGVIRVDADTSLSGVPASAWNYQLGNRSAIEWVLDQYKEKKPKDPTIRAKFDTYRFADHKEKVIDLLARVTTVSVETVRIVETLRAALR
ncbi:MAG: N-6 DNA methylase [Vicinamibacteria bacterium]|nr:N-6 DNA methylase [Vicinamibacteria bacterium]